MLPLVRALAVAACLLTLGFPAAAHAQLDLSVVSSRGAESVGNGDDVVGPGDRFSVDATIGTATALTGAEGILYTATPGVTPLASTSAFPDAPAGGQTANSTPFEALIAADAPCGANVDFALDVTDDDGAMGTVRFRVPTGTGGPLNPTEGVAAALADEGVTDVNLAIAQAGRVKRIELRIGSLTHPRLGDLRLELIAPDGATTVLAHAGSLAGTAMTDTAFAADGSPIAWATAPYTGRFAPAESFAGLEGRVLNGTWRLRVTDTVAGETGTLDAWGLDASRAFCSGIPKAAFTATPSRATPGDTVQFDASTSLDGGGGTIEGYEWDLDGDGQFDDGTTPQVQRTYPDKGRVPIRLRVTDNDGLTDIEERNLPVTLPPVAAVTATPTNPLTGDTFRLDAAGSSDPDGTVVRYQWDVDGDGAYERDSQGTSFIDASLPTAGDVTARVLVTDEDGAQDEESVQLTVRNRPPVAAVADPGLVVRGRPATLSAASSTDPDGGIVLYEWDLDGNGTYETDGGNEPTLEHTFATAGAKTIGVRVTDDSDATATATRSFTVTNAPSVSVVATPNPVSLRDPVAIDASASNDPDDPAAVLTYEWDLEDDGTFAAPGPPTATTSWATAGTRTVKVRVTDPSGAATVGSVAIVVRNILPAGTLSIAPATPEAGETVQLNAAGSTDPDGTIVRFQWDLDGDGAYERDTGTALSTSTSFANHGNVTVGVRLTDDDGGTGTKTLTFAVARPGDPAAGDDDAAPVKPATSPGDADPLAPPADPLAPPGGDPAPPVLDPDRPFGAWLGGAAIQRSAQVLARGALVSCRAEIAAWCSLRIRLSRRDARRLELGRKAVTVARTALPVPAGESARQRIKLKRRARRALRGAKSVRLLVRAAVRSADGQTVRLTRTVLLRR